MHTTKRTATAPPAWMAGLAIGCAGLIFVGLWRPGAVDQRPRRFGVVEPGRIYRGGYADPHQIEWLVRNAGIRGIVTLMKDPSDSERGRNEAATAQSLGLRLEEFPMPGDGRGDFEALDQAAAALARADGPVFVHCAAGQKRTGAAVAAYRLRYCGWSLDQAFDELRRHGVDLVEDSELFDHLRAYDASRMGKDTPPAAGKRP